MLVIKLKIYSLSSGTFNTGSCKRFSEDLCTGQPLFCCKSTLPPKVSIHFFHLLWKTPLCFLYYHGLLNKNISEVRFFLSKALCHSYTIWLCAWWLIVNLLNRLGAWLWWANCLTETTNTLSPLSKISRLKYCDFYFDILWFMLSSLFSIFIYFWWANCLTETTNTPSVVTSH